MEDYDLITLYTGDIQQANSGSPVPDESRYFTRASYPSRQVASPQSPLPSLIKSKSSEPSISSSPGPLTPPSYNEVLSKRPDEQLYCPESAPVYNLYNEINEEQRRLLADPRVLQQVERFKKAQENLPKTYYGAFAPVGLHILQYGLSAQTSDIAGNADFLVGDSKQLEDWLTTGNGDKLFLLRDPDWLQTRPEAYGSTILEELRTTAIDRREMQIEVQHLGKLMSADKDNHSVEPMAIDQVIEQFATRAESEAPINLLSLMCRADGTVPWPLAKHCNLLNQAAVSAASLAQSSFYATAGKQATEVISKYIDLQSCMHFMIFGQAGAISSWHMDSIGPYTYITLEPNAKGQPPEDVLKLWAYVRTDHLSPLEQSQIKSEFQRTGLAYHPDPSLVRILALTAGDTLIMPPGTIHAPITITDCLFRGGMVMQKKQMRRSIREWRFCAENDICTNEDQPKQARTILDYFRRQVRANPESCGYLGPLGLDEFERDCIAIGGNSMSCRCASACKKGRCGCANNTQRCGAKCHKGVTRCDNPFGCEADVLVPQSPETKTE